MVGAIKYARHKAQVNLHARVRMDTCSMLITRRAYHHNATCRSHRAAEVTQTALYHLLAMFLVCATLAFIPRTARIETVLLMAVRNTPLSAEITQRVFR